MELVEQEVKDVAKGKRTNHIGLLDYFKEVSLHSK